jgi:uncharacterized repeat protein (TIGR01451 family)
VFNVFVVHKFFYAGLMILNFYNNNLIKQYFNIFAVLKYFPVKKNPVEKNVSALLIFITVLLASTNVFSAAGDLISNTATINYDIAGVPGVSNASTAFTEDRLINFVVTEANGGAAVPVMSDMTDAVMQFTVTNTGNDVHDFLLTAANTSPNPFGLPADSFDPLPGTIQVFVESGATPGYQTAQDTAVFIDELVSNNPRTVYLVADLPTIVTDDVAAVALIVQIAEAGAGGVEGAAINADDNGRISPAGVFSNGSTNVPVGISVNNPDTPGMETVFNDPAGANPEDISSDLNQDIAGNGQHSDTGAYQVSQIVVLSKSVTVIDTLGGNDPHPGATLRYQLNVSVAGNTPVSNLVINDPVPANTTYTVSSILLNGVSQTDANDAPADYSRAIDILSLPVVSVEVDLSKGGTVSVAPGITNVIIFEVTID